MSSELSALLSPALSGKKNKERFLLGLDDRILALEADAQRTEAEKRFREEFGENFDTDVEKARCAADPLYWFDHWAWTYDPRLIAQNKVPYVRFILWPKQREFITWLHAKVSAGEPFVLEKSRDQGATYLVTGYAIWRWLFTPGFKTTFCSRDADNVDLKGNADSIFEKLRVIFRRLPSWMLPAGFTPRIHDNIMQLTNPATGATITGETGDNPGRGGRSSFYLVDEAAFLAHPQKVEAATSGNADCIGWISTPNPEVGGLSNFFARKRAAFANIGSDMVFRLYWRDDPRKNDEWARKKKLTLADPSTWEAEYEISYVGSTEGMAVPYKWVLAAVALYKEYGASIKRSSVGVTGGDVGAGKAKSVCVHRFGSVFLAPDRRQDGDTTGTAYWMLDCMVAAGTKSLNFDVPGVGAGVLSTLTHIGDDEDGSRKKRYASIKSVHPVNTGVPASGRVWPDDQTSEEKFGNLKAEIWWLARGAFQRSYLHYHFLKGTKEDGRLIGEKQEWDEVIVITDDATLQTQLSTPKWFRNEKGKIVIETKAQLTARHVASPDDADAFVLTFLEAEADYGFHMDAALQRENPFVIR